MRRTRITSLAFAVGFLLAACGASLQPSPPTSNSRWFWDCPGSIHAELGCYELACGQVIRHPLAVCCLSAVSPSGGASWPVSYEAAQACEVAL